jgi:hypothetical protein
MVKVKGNVKVGGKTREEILTSIKAKYGISLWHEHSPDSPHHGKTLEDNFNYYCLAFGLSMADIAIGAGTPEPTSSPEVLPPTSEGGTENNPPSNPEPETPPITDPGYVESQ